MVPRWIVTTIMVMAMAGTACGQGILDSVLGPGGLGVWGGGQPPQQMNQQFSDPQFYGAQNSPMQFQGQGYPPQEQYPQYPQQGAPPSQYGYPQQAQPQQYGQPPYSNESGVYADWYEHPPAVPGGEHVPQAYPQQTAPPVQYTMPPQGPPQQQQMQGPPQQQQMQGPPPQGQYQGQYPPGQYHPGQYSTQQGPPSGADDLPAGAVRVTTTTPSGTTVQYYPPVPDPDNPQAMAPQRPRPRRASAPRRARPRPQTQNAQSGPPAAARPSPNVQYNTSTSIAVPQPVQIPAGRDPRAGWESKLDQLPADNM